MLLTFVSLTSGNDHFMAIMLGVNAVVWNLSIMALSTEIRAMKNELGTQSREPAISRIPSNE